MSKAHEVLSQLMEQGYEPTSRIYMGVEGSIDCRVYNIFSDAPKVEYLVTRKGGRRPEAFGSIVTALAFLFRTREG